MNKFIKLCTRTRNRMNALIGLENGGSTVDNVSEKKENGKQNDYYISFAHRLVDATQWTLTNWLGENRSFCTILCILATNVTFFKVFRLRVLCLFFLIELLSSWRLKLCAVFIHLQNRTQNLYFCLKQRKKRRKMIIKF